MKEFLGYQEKWREECISETTWTKIMRRRETKEIQGKNVEYNLATLEGDICGSICCERQNLKGAVGKTGGSISRHLHPKLKKLLKTTNSVHNNQKYEGELWK